MFSVLVTLICTYRNTILFFNGFDKKVWRYYWNKAMDGIYRNLPDGFHPIWNNKHIVMLKKYRNLWSLGNIQNRKKGFTREVFNSERKILVPKGTWFSSLITFSGNKKTIKIVSNVLLQRIDFWVTPKIIPKISCRTFTLFTYGQSQLHSSWIMNGCFFLK